MTVSGQQIRLDSQVTGGHIQLYRARTRSHSSQHSTDTRFILRSLHSDIKLDFLLKFSANLASEGDHFENALQQEEESKDIVCVGEYILVYYVCLVILHWEQCVT